MQSWNFFIHLRFILTVFKHKYLKIGDMHPWSSITFRMFCYEERPFNRKDSVKFYFARDIGEKRDNKQNHPIKIYSLFTWKRYHRLFF